MSKTTYHTGERIVIVAGPSFGQALKFIVFGALLGAGAMTYLKPKPIVAPKRGGKGLIQDLAFGFIGSKFGGAKSGGAKADAKPDAKTETFKPDSAKFSATSESTTPTIDVIITTPEATEGVADRIESLTSRLKSLGSRAKQLVETAGEAVKPTLETAIAEGKRVAAEVQSGLKKDVAEAGDKPAIAEQDGELPSEREDKFIE